MPGEPSADQRGLVRPVVVHDDVHVQVGRHLDIEGGQEGAKLDRAMPPTNLTQHVSRLHFQRGKERRRPVPFVVVGPPFSLARAQGEQRRRAIQGLDLRLFVDAEDRSVRRRIEIQPHDVADLVDEQRIRRQLEALRAMRLQSERLPDAMHTHRTDARGLRQRARAPVGRAARCRFQRPSYDGFHLRIVDRPRGTRPRFVEQPIDALVDKPRRCCMKTRAGGEAWPAFLWILRRSHTTGMKSKVHPRYKTKCRVANWPAYNQALVRRGDVTLWLSSEAIAAWTPRRSGQRGGQRRYSDLAIETALTLRLLYHLPLRQAEGFLRALFGMMRLDLSAPDYTTLSRRSQYLRCRLRPVPTGEGIHLVLDSTGLSIVGAGEWAAAKHGGRGRRGWRKLHLGVDQSGVIRVHTLTEETGDDATIALDLLTVVEGPLVRVTADAAYDTVAVYETAGARGATVVVPPARTANVSGHGPRSPARDRTITLVKTLGRRQWKKASGYHRQGGVENTFFRYKSIIGDGLRARSPAGQGSEVVLGCEILNRMTEFGRPVSYRIGR